MPTLKNCEEGLCDILLSTAMSDPGEEIWPKVYALRDKAWKLPETDRGKFFDHVHELLEFSEYTRGVDERKNP